MAKYPLEGIRVIDLTTAFAGPYATMFLADMGAEVICAECCQVHPPGRGGQWARPPQELIDNMAKGRGNYPDRKVGARPWNRDGYVFNSHARSKLSITVNLTWPNGKEIFRRLVEKSDVFIENQAIGVVDRLGISYDVLSQWNPRLIMISASGMGQNGPWSRYRMWGSHLGFFMGLASVMGYTDMGPEGIPACVSPDPVAGITVASAALMGLHQRHRTGEGQHIDLSQGENFTYYIGEHLMDYFLNGRVDQSTGNRHPSMVQGCYRCKGEDEWITMSIATDKQWQALCRVMGRLDLATDTHFADTVSRLRHHDEIDRLITEWTIQHDPISLFQALQREGVPAGHIMFEDHAFADPHLKEQGFFVPVTHPETGPMVDGKDTPGTHLYPGALFTMSKVPFKYWRYPVRLGEDNEYIYKKVLGYSDEEYAQFEEEGHIGMDYIPSIR